MLDLAIDIAFGSDGRPVQPLAYCEREGYAASQLLNLMEAGFLGAAPIWPDLATFPGKQFRGLVDILVAGLPCQPYSVAGKREGNTDKRSFGDGDGPIVHALRIIDEVRPAVVFLENVPAWVAAREQWFKPVGERLCDLGYTLEDPLFLAASDVGASHQRERVFILAFDASRGQRVLRQSSGRDGFADGSDAPLADTEYDAGRAELRIEPREESRRLPTTHDDSRVGPAIGALGHAERPRANARPSTSGERDPACESSRQVEHAFIGGWREGSRRPEVAFSQSERNDADHGSTPSEPSVCLADPCSAGSQRGEQRIACDRNRGGQETHGSVEQLRCVFAPGPSDSRWPAILERFPWLAPATESGVHGMVDGTALVVDESRTNQLRAGGNGAVPLAAAAAFVLLARRVMA